MDDSIRSGLVGRLAAFTVAGMLLVACQPAEQSGTGDEMEKESSSVVTSEGVIQMERSIWQALGQGDHAAFGEKIADDFTYPSGAGVIGKAELMANLEGATVESYEIGDFRVKQPGSNVALVTYRYTETFRPADADSTVTYRGWATSVWENRGGTWMVVLHHSSEATEPTE